MSPPYNTYKINYSGGGINPSGPVNSISIYIYQFKINFGLILIHFIQVPLLLKII